jgi:hypothetical protein
MMLMRMNCNYESRKADFALVSVFKRAAVFALAARRR